MSWRALLASGSALFVPRSALLVAWRGAHDAVMRAPDVARSARDVAMLADGTREQR